MSAVLPTQVRFDLADVIDRRLYRFLVHISRRPWRVKSGSTR
jgi:hypothetical protein